MCNNNGACRALGRRRDVPELSRHPRRARRHARPRQLAAARHHRPAWAGCADLRRDGGDAEALRVLQGLPPRMPDRRRHGADEDRGAGGARGEIRAVAARPAGRLSAALRALCGEGAVAAESARRAAGRGEVVGGRGGLQRAALAAAMALGCFPTTVLREPFRPRDARERAYGASTSRAGGGGEANARSCSSPTPSTAISSARISMPRWPCSTPAAIACMSPNPSTAHRARCAAAARSSPSARWTRRATRPSARSRRLSRSSRAACPVVGLEPSCLLSFRDEVPAMVKGEARQAPRRSGADLRGVPGARGESGTAQPAAEEDRRPRAGARPLPSEGVRRLQRGRDRAQARPRARRSRPIESSCCGMAGSFGYAADTIDVSLAMGELSLLPAVRKADAGTHHRRRRHLLPPPDPRRHRPRGDSCCARAGDESPIATRHAGEMTSCRCLCCRPRWSAPTPSRNG